MKRIALVCPLYGTEVRNSDARYARYLAEQLVKRYEVDVLTTKALDDSTWRNWYARDNENIRGVTVRRFNTEKEKAGNIKSYADTYHEECINGKTSFGVEKIWIEKYGPFAPDCIRYIIRNRDRYDVIIFAGCMNYLTIAGMPEAAGKSVLIPLIREDCPYYDFMLMQQMFRMPSGFVFFTDEERLFVRKRFRTQRIPCEVMGTGTNIPENLDEAAFCRKYQVRGRFIAYAGRTDNESGFPQLVNYFLEFKRRNPESRLQLAVIGNPECRLPENDPDIIITGEVNEQDYFSGISAAAVFAPSAEKVGIPSAMLSAMAMGVPVLADGSSDGLREHCRRSNAGLYYNNYYEFEAVLARMLRDSKLCEEMSKNALIYVRENYEWDVVIEKFIELLGNAVR